MLNLFAVNILLAISLLCSGHHQDPKPTQPTSGSNQTKAKSPNSVELATKEAEDRGETVVVGCLPKCKDILEQTPTGVITGRAIQLKTPAYSDFARKAHVSGDVRVQILIGKDGKVIAAHAIDGDPLLQPAAVKAARESVFAPSTLEGKPVLVTGEITYSFATNRDLP